MNVKKILPLRLRRYLKNHRTRAKLKKHLQEMNRKELDRLTLDLGLSRADLVQEANRPFWKARS